MDLPLGNTNTQPIEVGGVLYFATGLSIVHAVDAVTGKELWRYDPHAAEKAGLNLRFGWGVRGIAWWEGLVFTGTQDGRLVAIDAKTGKLAWSAQTYPPDYPAYISGAPRVFDGKVLIGFGGTAGPTRGYVTAYDARTGRKLWRFYTVPGDPSTPFENAAMAMAAKTWVGPWWKYGGGGDVWNSMAYDAETDTVFIGVGSGYPWNRKRRSADEKGDRGDNLFLCSIVALDAKTGAYKWHYQVVPGETWDFDATMDIELADITIDGKPRKVLLHAPKSGFFYVIDRLTGELISAEPFAAVTWAKGIDKRTGRPIEAPGVRYENGNTAFIRPAAMGAHSWMPMAYSPQTGLVYIPTIDFEIGYSDASKSWTIPQDRRIEGALNMTVRMGKATGSLLAWSPLLQKKVWEIQQPTNLNGGVLATGGRLVFQGTVDGFLRAYDADKGRELWRFDAKAPILGTPISYAVGGRQYVSLLTGLGMNHPSSAPAIFGAAIEKYDIDPRTQARRVLTFALGDTATLPPRKRAPPFVADAAFVVDRARVQAGAYAFADHCANCHGSLAIGISMAPDLRRSPIPSDRALFTNVVRNGALVPDGMPSFAEFPDAKLEAIREYILSRAAESRR
jgi:quinohemoprotein ethanol dehydrogenase